MKKQQKITFREKFEDLLDRKGMDEFKGMTFDEILLVATKTNVRKNT